MPAAKTRRTRTMISLRRAQQPATVAVWIMKTPMQVAAGLAVDLVDADAERADPSRLGAAWRAAALIGFQRRPARAL